MTGTDRDLFAAIASQAKIISVRGGSVDPP
jgi:hypothetical protein